jgi:PII-like signaling protein
MQAPCDATLLRIFIGDDDTFDDKPLCDQIVLKARSMGLAGATVTRGTLAFGPASRELQIELRLSEDRPIVIDIVDTDAKINEFLQILNNMVESGLVIVQPVSVLRYGRKAKV